MNQARAFGVGVAIALATACSIGMAQASRPASAASGSADKAGAAERAVRPHTLVVVPAAISMSTDFAKGCWVRLYDGKDFQGQELMLVGPLGLTGMGTTSPWWRRWNSAVVGPQARVTLYSSPSHAGRFADLAAGQRSADLVDKELGWTGKIESARVDCNAR